MYVLLSGYLPFYGKNEKEVFDKIKKGALTFEQKEFDVISEPAKDLIKKLLTVDKRLRFNCAQALKHNWFKEIEGHSEKFQKGVDPQVIESLTKFNGSSYLKKEAMNILVKTLQEKEILYLKK